MAVRTKICGITSVREARILNACPPDYAGFVMFYEKSKRNNTAKQAGSILEVLDPKIQRVAVTVSPTLEQVMEICRMDFQVLQVHGALSEEAARACTLPIWRAYHVVAGQKPEMDPQERGRIAGYVLDGARPGSGEPFSWKALQSFRRDDKMLILAGGLCAANVEAAIEALSPDVVDVSTAVEGSCGKDAWKIKEFIGKVKAHE